MAASTKILTRTCKHVLKFRTTTCLPNFQAHRQFQTTENVYKTKAAIRLRQSQRTERQLQRVAQQVEGKTSFSKPKGKISARVNPAIAQILSHGFRKQGDQLGRLYSAHITEIFEQGQFSPKLIELGFLISEVNLRLDRNELRIHWAAIEPENDDQIELLLKDCGTDLREALLAVPSLGVVPQIVFLKSNTGRHQDVVEEILKSADFGPDFVATDAAAPFRTTPEKCLSPHQLKKSLAEVAKTFTGPTFETIQGPGGSQEVLDADVEKNALDQLEQLSRSTYPDEYLPEEFSDLKLRSDVYDVKHDDIMHQIAHTKKRLSRLRINSEVAPLDENPVEVKSIKKGAINNQELMNKVLGQYRRLEGSRSRKKNIYGKRSQGKRNLSMDDAHIIL
ncbi:hypothetical protein CAPTEDRAFT_205400 [Capitella teleta]|uniref:Ribosome-binding factor A, mitochondrial n=1 Tax=Capitella teleta TaxID=283909 RepID=R7TM44_CAPTE|nr:hypothetical protein CAPTEDRAFT_205400 [Capitella teleta]|eukprot:ELT94893.1 hypothetical protein CAPTEDRAFT_205400 [Capitella teleta]